MCPSIHEINKQLIMFYMTRHFRSISSLDLSCNYLLFTSGSYWLTSPTRCFHSRRYQYSTTTHTHSSLHYFMLFLHSVPFLYTPLVPSPIHSTVSLFVDNTLRIILTTHLYSTSSTSSPHLSSHFPQSWMKCTRS